MAQFDVHRNKGALRDSIPFVVVVQSVQFDRYRRRVVVPLVRQSLLPRDTPTVGARMNPVFVIDGVPVVLHPLDMVSVALDQLGETVGSLEQEGQVIADALDELLTRTWG
ncbi:MAG: CcdB family protein [Hydrogenophaga sp.]|uniref:CcdB family protein n=1 Tax=Hydrogenophaga sp. TaxID=1904254 RepID=UPI002716F9A2|nr:CcdB family protein [Hydrogenophaga sp.]MDO9504840.1 CcdB family protein [Hydrogenophaga sp.]MDP2988147.1 CcdB family protein [Hydrogenophaga sp.]MDP3205392.1 CcdB family protein [Hydrogenophaga sp.]MDP3628058.1 CcdB family protein [Hydrogenophaga sp.]